MNSKTARSVIYKTIGMPMIKFLGPMIVMLDREKSADTLGQVKANLAEFPEIEYVKQNSDCDDIALAKIGWQTIVTAGWIPSTTPAGVIELTKRKSDDGRGWMGFAKNDVHAYAFVITRGEELYIDVWGQWRLYTEVMRDKDLEPIFKLKNTRLLSFKYWIQGRFFKRDLLIV